MTYCCEHTKKAHELIRTACKRLMGVSEEETSTRGQVFRAFVPFLSTYDKVKMNKAVKEYKEWMEVAREYLKKAEKEMNACVCSEEEKNRAAQSEIKAMKRKEELKELREENINITAENSGLKGRMEEKEKFIGFSLSELEITRKERDEREIYLRRTQDKLELKESELAKANSKISDLNLEKIENKEERESLKVNNRYLWEQLQKLEEESSEQRLTSKEEKLDKLVRKLKIKRSESRELQNAYEKWFRAKRLNEKDTIRNEKNNIEEIKDKFSILEVESDDLERVYELCKEIAELKLQSEEKLEARTEVPPHNFYRN